MLVIHFWKERDSTIFPFVKFYPSGYDPLDVIDDVSTYVRDGYLVNAWKIQDFTRQPMAIADRIPF